MGEDMWLFCVLTDNVLCPRTTVLMYNVTIQRSWQPYVRGYIMLQVLLNMVGFSAFWLPPSCGERMSLVRFDITSRCFHSSSQ